MVRHTRFRHARVDHDIARNATREPAAAIQRLDDAIQLLLETHLEQSIGLIKHEPAALADVKTRSVLQVVQQTPRRRHKHSAALAQTLLLVVLRASTSQETRHHPARVPLAALSVRRERHLE